MKYDTDCLIIGAGIAGMTAAIYLKRSNVNFIIIDKDAPGGLLNKINLIENYPGIKSITGPELAYNLYEQLTNLGINIKYGNVLKIEGHNVITDIETITANKIILATGRSAKKLNNSSNKKNVSYCALCDGNLYKDKCVAVIGNNAHTVNDAIYLSDICKNVILIIPKNIEYELNKKNIKVVKVKTLNNIIPNESIVKSIKVNNNEYLIDGLFISLGYEPQLDFLDNIKKDNGYIIVNEKMQTNEKFIYACGDIIKKEVYQLTTATADATIAAINVKKTIKINEV